MQVLYLRKKSEKKNYFSFLKKKFRLFIDDPHKSLLLCFFTFLTVMNMNTWHWRSFIV